ncbi:hypothetical protein [Bradyrhizobium lablabi]|uniref:hypothetical protein n=1 Tax=Bradyrhizobium lablabi TaxID=722472 RepID=UPI0009A7A914|nr:hypothetical protein [Bradyrhizobium lablabi]
MREQEDDFAFTRTKWRCSACGRLNSMERDNVCPKCFDLALDEDQKKLDSPVSLQHQGGK